MRELAPFGFYPARGAHPHALFVQSLCAQADTSMSQHLVAGEWVRWQP